MKHIRISPWLILVLASVLVVAAGCDRPDPQVAIDTPQPMNVTQQPVEPQTVGTPTPGGETQAPGGAATPTLPSVIVATLEGTPAAGGQATPQQPVEPQTVGTPTPGGGTQAPGGAATPTLPSVIVATLEGTPATGGQATPQQTVGTPAPGGAATPTVPPVVAATTAVEGGATLEGTPAAGSQATPQQPVEPQTVGTPAPGGAATPTVPPVVAATTAVEGGATLEGTPAAGGQATPQIQPTAPLTQTTQVQPTAPVNAQGNAVHMVKPGETLFSIAQLYGVNPYSITAANNIPYPYIIYPGQQLIIPTGSTPPPGPTPVPPKPGQCRYYHTVRPGQNLYRISLAYGVPMSTIAAANGIVNYNLIYAWQTLCIP